MSSTAAAAAGIMPITAFNMWSQSEADARQQRYYVANTKMNFGLAQRAERASALNQREGLELAGYNPALGTEGKFSGVVGNSAPLGQSHAPQIDPMALNDLLNDKSLRNKTDQEARLAETEADLKENEVKRREDADNSFVITYRQNLEREKADLKDQLSKTRGTNSEAVQTRIREIDGSLEKLKDPNYAGTIGILEGYKAGAEQARSSFAIVNNFLEGKLSKDVLIKKLGNGTANVLATTDKANRQKLNEDIEAIRQGIAESESREELNDQQILHLQTLITKLGNDVIHQNLNDPNFIKYMFGTESEEWKNWTDTQWREEAFRVGERVIEGVATGTGLGMVSKLLGPKSRSPKKPHKVPTSVDYNSSTKHNIKFPDSNPFLD